MPQRLRVVSHSETENIYISNDIEQKKQ